MNNDNNLKVVNDMKDLSLKMLELEKILIYLRRLRMSRAKKLIIKSKSNEEKKMIRFKIQNPFMLFIIILLCFKFGF